MQREHADIDVTQSAAALAKAIVQSEAKAAGIDTERKQQAKPKAKAKASAAVAETAEQPKAKKEPKPKVVRPTCESKKKDGTPCTAHCMADVPYCTDHRPADQHLTKDEFAVLDKALHEGSAYERTARVVAWLGWGKAKLLAAKLQG